MCTTKVFLDSCGAVCSTKIGKFILGLRMCALLESTWIAVELCALPKSENSESETYIKHLR